jgi:excisionase family DNA binding protein
MTYKNWLKRQLRKLDTLDDELDENQYDDLREVIYESARRASLEGNVEAIQACKMRHGGAAPDLVREVLAECLATIENQTPTHLTPPVVAKKLSVSRDTVLNWIRNGELKASNIAQRGKRPRYRITPEALAKFEQMRNPEPRQARRGSKYNQPPTLITRFSTDQ